MLCLDYMTIGTEQLGKYIFLNNLLGLSYGTLARHEFFVIFLDFSFEVIFCRVLKILKILSCAILIILTASGSC